MCEARTKMIVSYGTDVGLRRKNNEDFLHVDEKLNLFIVADGVGGHERGEDASKIAIDTFVDNFDKNKSFTELAILCDKAVSSLEYSRFGASPGTTLIAVHKDGNSIRWLSVGDSYIFLIKGDDVLLMNTLDDAGGLITQALGGHYKVFNPHTGVFKLQDDEVLILASDGIDEISRKTIAKLVKESDFDTLAEDLINAVNQNGGRDNTTVICIKNK